MTTSGLPCRVQVNVYVAMLAVLKTGAAYVPLDPEFPADRITYILDDCHARTLITTSSLSERFEGFEGVRLTLDGDFPEFGTLSSLDVTCEGTPEDVCYVIYTSGTTGRPKGVQIEHRSVSHLVLAEAELFEIQPEDRVYQGFSVAFDASVEEIWLAFQAGATLVVGTREMVEAGPALGKMLTDAAVTVFSTVPTLLSMLEDDLPTVRLLILGGEACPPDLSNAGPFPAGEWSIPTAPPKRRSSPPSPSVNAANPSQSATPCPATRSISSMSSCNRPRPANPVKSASADPA